MGHSYSVWRVAGYRMGHNQNDMLELPLIVRRPQCAEQPNAPDCCCARYGGTVSMACGNLLLLAIVYCTPSVVYRTILFAGEALFAQLRHTLFFVASLILCVAHLCVYEFAFFTLS